MVTIHYLLAAFHEENNYHYHLLGSTLRHKRIQQNCQLLSRVEVFLT